MVISRSDISSLTLNLSVGVPGKTEEDQMGIVYLQHSIEFFGCYKMCLKRKFSHFNWDGI